MSETASRSAEAARAPRITELKVSGHMIALDTGLFCIVHMPAKDADAASGFPGVSIAIPPSPVGRPEAVEIRTVAPDGWLSGYGDAALVRVTQGPVQLLVTIYQPAGAPESKPNLQVVRLTDSAPPPAHRMTPATPLVPRVMDIMAHIQGRGDVGALLGDWMGEPGSKRWIEGFAIAPSGGLAVEDIEYQAVLGPGWRSPWIEGGQFCGSRGMALPVLGLRLRLRGKAAEEMDCSYVASFVDGTRVGPVPAGETCEAESHSPLEAFQITITPRGGAATPPTPVPAAKTGGKARARAK